MARAVKLSTRDGWWKFARVIHAGESFTTSGALRGEGDGYCPMSPFSGRLEGADYDALRDALAIDYVVWSYATPIAWHDARDGWYVVKQSFSVTTSRHQSKIATAIANPHGAELAY